jgi:hypothetical protein
VAGPYKYGNVSSGSIKDKISALQEELCSTELAG